jgi:hypothetical protein
MSLLSEIKLPRGYRPETGTLVGDATFIEKIDSFNDLFQCQCGKKFQCKFSLVKHGKVRGCGCRQGIHKPPAGVDSHAFKHGKIKTTLYAKWHSMKNRCYSPGATGYEYYGGRGIVVCDRWKNSFEDFEADMGECPAGCSLERKDLNGDYSPENCEWATRKTQLRNTSANRLTFIDGKIMTRVEASEYLGVNPKTITRQLNSGKLVNLGLRGYATTV